MESLEIKIGPHDLSFARDKKKNVGQEKEKLQCR
jgi:hypothetical protein